MNKPMSFITDTKNSADIELHNLSAYLINLENKQLTRDHVRAINIALHGLSNKIDSLVKIGSALNDLNVEVINQLKTINEITAGIAKTCNKINGE